MPCLAFLYTYNNLKTTMMNAKARVPQRHVGTVMRDNRVHDEYAKVLAELGHWASAVSRVELYKEVASRTHTGWKTVQHTLNHTRKEKV